MSEVRISVIQQLPQQNDAYSKLRKAFTNVAKQFLNIAPNTEKLSATPANADNYGIGWTDLFAGATVDAIGRPMRQALTVRHLKTFDRTGIYAIPTPRTFFPIH